MEEGNLLLSNAKTADNTEDLIYGCLDRCRIPIGRWGSPSIESCQYIKSLSDMFSITPDRLRKTFPIKLQL